MDDTTRTALTPLLMALKSLGKAVEKSVLTGTYEGTGDMIARQYHNLHTKIAQLLPDDYYVAEVLKLDQPAGGHESQKIAQVNLAVGQLVGYLENLLKGGGGAVISDVEDIKEMGRELQQQILSVTRKALKRALANIDIDVDVKNTPDAPTPPDAPDAPKPPVV
ncbi:MAG: hypothetical protein HXY40_11690 [Chloroflexi bacterium]|nr:hypothetical protein [Chloroflexota bacterium]